MFESECYFEAYRHTLKVLKDVPLAEFPMAKYIIGSTAQVRPPQYLVESHDLMKIGERWVAPLHGVWPNAAELALDPSQYEAFHAALTKEFAIIQGPPGTGKTFLGLKVVEALLANESHWLNQDSGPILIVCLTNHALDQFLEGILRLLKDQAGTDEACDIGLIRVGGRSQSDSLQEFSLAKRRYQARKLHQYDPRHRREESAAFRTVKQLETQRSDLMNEYSSLAMQNLQGIVDFHSLSVFRNRELGREFPFDLDFTRHLASFGLESPMFDYSNFSEENLVKQWFKIRAAKVEKFYGAVPPAKPKQQQQPQVEDDDDEDEDYDIDELQADRILEDIYYEVDSQHQRNKGDKGRNPPPAINYIPQGSISGLAELSSRRNEQNMNQNDNKSKYIAGNKSKFLQCFFKHLVDGLIELPDMEVRSMDMVSYAHNYVVRGQRLGGSIDKSMAWALYLHIIKLARKLIGKKLVRLETELIDAQKELFAIQRQGDGKLLQNTKVVGMTTTGASKAADLLEIMKSKIVIVEEAAEVLEAHIINCITQHCQHLIMIGDHQQLRPQISVNELATKYHLNISLFERMVNNSLNCYKLVVQHRMRPEISDLIRGSIYERLENHASVHAFPRVKGMVKNLYFITHRQFESADSDSMTKTNSYEAKYLAALCHYLILQGYKPSEITILATYQGQMFLIKKELQAPCYRLTKGVRVTAVDNFQGEENTIILLSLVRSNMDDNIGFLKTDNRICVALSRARQGLYIIGNMDSLIVTSSTWKTIQGKLKARSEIGPALEIMCQGHSNISVIKSPEDFKKYPEGGCTLICGKPLSCGHVCKSMCHQHSSGSEAKSHCMARCAKKCVNGHQCLNKCFMTCSPCGIQMSKTLRCGHVTSMKCSEPTETVRCQVQVEKILACSHPKELPCHASIEGARCDQLVVKTLVCGHKTPGMIPCSQKVTEIKCHEVVNKKLRCGHVKSGVKCHDESCHGSGYKCAEIVDKRLRCGHTSNSLCSIPDTLIKCETLIWKSFDGCPHKVQIPCHQHYESQKCGSPCEIRLPCGHQCRQICHPYSDRSHYYYKCEKTCVRSCPNGHPCTTQHKCHEPCSQEAGVCRIETTKFYACKTHTTKAKCNEKLDECLSPCEKTLDCGHKCGNLCFQRCGPCTVPVQKYSSCGHQQTIPCNEQPSPTKCNALVKAFSSASCGHYSVVPCRKLASISRDESKKYCQEPCNTLFDEKDGGCGHRCKGTCSECLQGRLHKKCSEVCGKSLVCGHICNFPCADFCPPCQQKCNMRCDHSRCDANCGEPCNDCIEPCTWKCPHKKCTKLCRDLCNRGPCNEPCTKKLPCGHTCIGLCGETCPPLCRTCDQPKLTEFILYGNEEDEDARFIYLEDCQHAIEVEGLDYYMNHDVEEGAIVAKSCPRCKTLIRHSKRYGNILRKRLADIIAVKRRIYGDLKDIKTRQESVVAELRAGTKKLLWTKYLETVYKYVLGALVTIVPVRKLLGIILSKEEIILKNVDVHTFGSLQLIINHSKDTIALFEQERSSIVPSLQIDLKTRYTDLFSKLTSRRLPLSRLEMNNFDSEFGRLFDLAQLYKRRSLASFVLHSRAVAIYEVALKNLDSSMIYNDEMKKSLHKHLKELDSLLSAGLGISEREKREVLAAIGLKQGHWFRCPNGHIYAVGECGGAMEESKCNECGAKIGGQHHRLIAGNALATEMDGALAPAYPSMH